jgi:futalosine hydrolase
LLTGATGGFSTVPPVEGLLVVAATERELGRLEGAAALVCGVGPVEAAAATARALAERRPRAVLHVGLAGGRGLAPPTLVLGSEALYDDLSAAIPTVSRAEPDAALLDAARRALPEARVLPIGTSAGVGRTRSDCPVEAMEGFAVLRAAELAGVPAVELRAVSNEVDEADRARWRFAEALDALSGATSRVVAALATEAPTMRPPAR